MQGKGGRERTEETTMTKRTLFAAGAALALAAAAHAQSAEDALGIWENPENKSHTEFYKCGDGVCGKIVRVVDGQKADDKNPDAAKRSRPIVGLVIMQGAKKTGPATWSGQLYNRADGKTYAGTLTVKSRNAVELSGCVLVFCKTTTFTRVK
jgi:uncharacterized protein (DUF2147 family)